VSTSLRNLRLLWGFNLIDSTCRLLVVLLEASRQQLTCQKFVDVNGTDFSLVCDKYPSLLCPSLCFDSDQSIQSHRTYKEAKPDNMHVPNVESVRFLQLFLTKYHTVNYISKCFRNLRRLFMEHTRYEEKVLEEIQRQRHLILWKSCSGKVKG